MENGSNFYLSPDLTVNELLDREPMVIKIFMALKLNCIGCAMDKFHTVADVARENHLDLDQLMRKIHNSLKNEKAETS